MVKTSEAESTPTAPSTAVWRREPRGHGQPDTASADDPARTKGAVIVLLALLALGSVLLLVAIGGGVFDRGAVQTESPSIRAIPAAYNGERAMGYLQELCRLGTATIGFGRNDSPATDAAKVFFRSWRSRFPCRPSISVTPKMVRMS